MDRHLGQRTRLLILLIEVLVLCAASRFATGSWVPPPSDKGYWFYTAMLGLVLSRRLDTPFYPTPADVVLYAAPAAVSMLLVNRWAAWGSGEKVAFTLALAYCVIIAILGTAAILSKDAASNTMKRFSNSARIVVEQLGTARWIYSSVVAFALYAFHRDSVREIGLIATAWVFTSLVSPLEQGLALFDKLNHLWQPNALTSAAGVVVAYQSPTILLVRQVNDGACNSGDVLLIRDSIRGATLALALDSMGRDDGILRRAIEFAGVKVPPDLAKQIASLPADSVARVSDIRELTKERMFIEKATLVGIVAADTTLDRLYFEVVQDAGLQQGSLVETAVAHRTVLYQVIDGLTREEIVQQRNTHGYCRAQAQKLGEWDVTAARFRLIRWIPHVNAPVFLKAAGEFVPRRDAIGHLPQTDYSVTLKSIDSLVTHNTAILGILGVGKTSLALELVERMIDAGVRVICIDLTNQYLEELAIYCDTGGAKERLVKLQEVGRAGKGKVSVNVGEGGSRQEFGKALLSDIEAFLTSDTERLRVFNPSEFEVWRQDGKEYKGRAPMAQLTPAEITQIISEATLRAVAKQGVTNSARACLVYEEAHTLVPEWNSAVAEGDKAATNGTARAILQGRKYGLGCLLITQRTANVTKTILNQCHTIFAMRTFDDTGKEFLGNYLGREHATTLSTLQERHAVVFGRASSCENPVTIRLNDRDSFTKVFRAPCGPRGADG